MILPGVTLFSLASAIIFFNVSLVMLTLCRRNTTLLMKFGVQSLVLIFCMSIFRLLFPIDLKYSYIIGSEVILPQIEQVLKYRYKTFPSIGTVLLIVWIIGCLCILIKKLHSYHLQTRSLRTFSHEISSQIERVMKKYHLPPISVRTTNYLDVPIVTGFFRPIIYFPTLDMTDEQAHLILLHEIQHVKNGDSFIKLFYLFITALFWWNPVVHIFEKELDNILEFRCDLALVKKISPIQRLDYLNVILDVAKKVSSPRKLSTNMSSFVKLHSGQHLKQRFYIVSEYNDRKIIIPKILTLCFIYILFFFSYFVIIQPREYPSPDELENEIAIFSHNSYLIKNGDNYDLYIENIYYETLPASSIDSEPFNQLTIRNKEERKNAKP